MALLGIPAGRYPARVGVVNVTRGRNQRNVGAWFLQVEATVLRNNKLVREHRPLSRTSATDPFALAPTQVKGLQTYARRLGVQDTGPAEEIVAAIKRLGGEKVTAHVRPGPMGLHVSLYALEDGPVTGEVLDPVPATEYTERTQTAQSAHEQLLAGLHHANKGLALAAEAAWKIRQEEGWLALGYAGIGEYLAGPEIGLSRPDFYALGDIWEQYIVSGGQDENRLVAPSKLTVPMRALKAGEVSPGDALTDAETLGLRDLRIKYRGEKEPESGRPDAASREFGYPFACAACGTVIEDDAGIIKEEAHG